MEYEATDEDALQPSGNMIPIALAVLAAVLGTAGLYFGFNANKRLNSIDSSMQESSTSSVEIEKSIAFFESRIAEFEEQISEQTKALNRLRAYGTQSEQAIKKLSGELNSNREVIKKIVRQLNETRAVLSQVNASRDASNTQSSELPVDTTTVTAEPKAERTYVIASGDTFGKIAARLGISVQAIIDANPNADPRRLRVGQKIVIPVE